MIQIDMPMPERCGVCFAMNTDETGLVSWCGIDETARDIYTEEINTKRPDWCPLKEQETANLYKCPNCGTWVSAENVVRCKDCDNKECCGRAGNVVCGIDGTPHRPEWYCADGERKETDGH